MLINWLRANHRDIVAFSRPIILMCAAALLGIANLPHTLAWRVVADIGLVAVAIVFLVWLSVALTVILRPGLLHGPGDGASHTRGDEVRADE